MTREPLRVAVLYGGTSAEHEVSCASAASVVRHLDPLRYRVTAIGVDRDGGWHRLPAAALSAARRPPSVARAIDDGLPVCGPPEPVGALLADVDVVFPVMHGPGGEDGALQGLLEILGVPYVGAGVLASALGMDKVACKRALVAAGLPVARYTTIDEAGWVQCVDPARLVAGLRAPWFVKPANLGSSIGITMVTRPDGLAAAIDTALEHDGLVLIEQGVRGARELECGVLGGDRPEASVVGEVLVTGGWFDFEQKYYARSDPMVVPADLPTEVAERARELSVRAFRAIGGWGLARVDLLLEAGSGDLVVNELNTLPGFTAHSMYPKVWAAMGLGYPELLDRLIGLALERHDRRRLRKDSRHASQAQVSQA